MFTMQQKNRGCSRWRQGFTLIELLVVIAIISILVTTFAISTSSARESAQIAKATAEARELTNSIHLYVLTNLQLDDNGEGEEDPLSQLGLNEGFGDISTSTTTKLTDPSSNDKKVRYFNCAAESIVNGKIVDPWGNPYKIRVKKRQNTSKKDKNDLAQEYEVLLPVHSRYAELPKLSGVDAPGNGAYSK
jgi:prepilin-type N-terminal cleavage/methylation domain-containing protein